MLLDMDNTSYRFWSISNDFDINFRRKCIYNKISLSPQKFWGRGNVGFLDETEEIQWFTL